MFDWTFQTYCAVLLFRHVLKAVNSITYKIQNSNDDEEPKALNTTCIFSSLCVVRFLILVPTEGSPPPTNSFLYNTPSFKINQNYKVQCCTVIRYQNVVLQNQSLVLYIVWKRFSAGQLVPLSGHLVWIQFVLSRCWSRKKGQ